MIRLDLLRERWFDPPGPPVALVPRVGSGRRSPVPRPTVARRARPRCLAPVRRPAPVTGGTAVIPPTSVGRSTAITGSAPVRGPTAITRTTPLGGATAITASAPVRGTTPLGCAITLRASGLAPGAVPVSSTRTCRVAAARTPARVPRRAVRLPRRAPRPFASPCIPTRLSAPRSRRTCASTARSGSVRRNATPAGRSFGPPRVRLPGLAGLSRRFPAVRPTGLGLGARHLYFLRSPHARTSSAPDAVPDGGSPAWKHPRGRYRLGASRVADERTSHSHRVRSPTGGRTSTGRPTTTGARASGTPTHRPRRRSRRGPRSRELCECDVPDPNVCPPTVECDVPVPPASSATSSASPWL